MFYLFFLTFSFPSGQYKSLNQKKSKQNIFSDFKPSSTHLTVVIKDAAEVEDAGRTKVWGYLLACTGHMLHLRTVHHTQVSRDLKGAWSLGLSLGLSLGRHTCRLWCLVLGLFQGFVLSTEGHEHRLLLLLLLLLRKRIVRPWWLHTMWDSGRRSWKVGYSVVGVCNIVW